MNNKFHYTATEIKAKKVLDDCGLTDPTEISLPIIIKGRKAFYEEVPLKGREGEIVSVGDRSIISINSDILFETKKRFAAAHELGHYEMHRHIRPVFSDTEEELMSWYRGGTHEIEANEFAAEFLMPSELFHKECERKKFDPKIINQLSDRFQVSKTATILRFVKRGNHPIFVMYCKDGKMKWWKKSEDFYHFSVFEYDAPPPSGSVAYEIIFGNKAYSSDEAKQDIWKSDWFQMKSDREQDTRFYEYCLFARSFNYTLSVIWEK
ncbi:ImmA/IrrE family metallo-endopeptidase [Parafilimonas sp.]|uniref:ImmA/IrrE family metallo-endopeptidase n=1 Tax=Parafilimonas sp. TaxID=1969739 RepID=UPI0039E3F1B9